MAGYVEGPDVIWETEAFGTVHGQIVERFDPDEDPDTIRYHIRLDAAECPEEYLRQGRIRVVVGSDDLREDTRPPAEKTAAKKAAKKTPAAKKTAAKAAHRKGGSNSEPSTTPVAAMFSHARED